MIDLRPCLHLSDQLACLVVTFAFEHFMQVNGNWYEAYQLAGSFLKIVLDICSNSRVWKAEADFNLDRRLDRHEKTGPARFDYES